MTEQKTKDVFDVLQEQISALIREEPTNDEDARKRAELLTMKMHFALAYAHRCCTYTEQDRAEKFFDLAEEAGREAFSVESIHVARFTEDARPYKLALGSILSAGKSSKQSTTTRVGDFVRLSLCEVLCRIQKIDPDEMRELYRKWQEGEVH